MDDSSRFQWKLILVPFSWLYGLVVWIRNSLYDNGLFKSTGFNIPIISVGNITVGGTGKTPHTEYLAELLMKEFRLAILSRGYRRKSRDFRIATAGSRVREVGDEPLQVKLKFPEVTVAVDRNRVHGVAEIMKLALNNNAAALVFVHNHPSGDPQPSPEDKNLTKNLVWASQLLSIKVLDHIIIGHNRYFSFADEGVIKQFSNDYKTKINL